MGHAGCTFPHGQSSSWRWERIQGKPQERHISYRNLQLFFFAYIPIHRTLLRIPVIRHRAWRVLRAVVVLCDIATISPPEWPPLAGTLHATKHMDVGNATECHLELV